MLTQFEIVSGFLDTPRKLWVQPALVGPARDCLIFLDGELYMEGVRAPALIDDLQKAGDVPSMISAYLSYVDITTRARDFVCNQAFAAFVAMDLRRWIEQNVGGIKRFFLCGMSLSGLEAIFTALQHPSVFSGVMSQSPSAWWQDERLTRSLTPAVRNAGRFWGSVGDQEAEENVLHNPIGLFQTASQRDSVRRLAERLERLCREVRYREFSGGHDMACWAQELPGALSWLLQKT